jgi:hypothetical protein
MDAFGATLVSSVPKEGFAVPGVPGVPAVATLGAAGAGHAMAIFFDVREELVGFLRDALGGA